MCCLVLEWFACPCQTTGPTSPTAGPRWCGSGTFTPPGQECTCWSVRVDRSVVLPSRLCTVSGTLWSAESKGCKLQCLLLTAVCFAVGNISILGLMEIRPVGPGRVAIRGVATARFLCIEDDGTLYSSVSIIIILTKGEEYMFLFISLIKTRDTKFFPKSHKKD